MARTRRKIVATRGGNTAHGTHSDEYLGLVRRARELRKKGLTLVAIGRTLAHDDEVRMTYESVCSYLRDRAPAHPRDLKQTEAWQRDPIWGRLNPWNR